jgi:hypothetical protein
MLRTKLKNGKRHRGGTNLPLAYSGRTLEWHVDLCIPCRNMDLGQKRLGFPGSPFVTPACQSQGFRGHKNRP